MVVESKILNLVMKVFLQIAVWDGRKGFIGEFRAPPKIMIPHDRILIP